ncbi:hypothetical protein Tco_1282588 [Tanacetum coccineum]
MAPRGRPTRLNLYNTPTSHRDPTTTTSVTSAQLQAMIDEGVTAVLAARATTRNGDDSHTSGTGVRRNERAVRECMHLSRLHEMSTLILQGHRRSGRLDPMELALLCDSIFPEETTKLKRNVRGDSLTPMLLKCGGIELKDMQEAIEMAN